MSAQNNRTLLIAFGANLGIAAAKFVAAAITGSSAMLTEGVHSVVDSTNQLLLIWGRRQARKPADAIHPMGYGRELYFWSFIVAVLVFSLGAGVSIYEGIIHIADPEEAVSPLIAYARPYRRLHPRRRLDLGGVPGLQGGQGLARLVSRRSAARRIRPPSSSCSRMARRWPGWSSRRSDWRYRQMTGDPFYDGAASVVIGIILGLTALLLAVESKGLLIGEAADPSWSRALAR